MLKREFPGWRFEAPASVAAIDEAERALGLAFPAALRALYLEADGVREDIGNAAYLLPLAELVDITETLWAEWEGFRPEFDLKPFVFFGSSASDAMWGIRAAPPLQVIAFHHHMEGAYEVVGTDILAVYRADQARYAAPADED